MPRFDILALSKLGQVTSLLFCLIFPIYKIGVIVDTTLQSCCKIKYINTYKVLRMVLFFIVSAK